MSSPVDINRKNDNTELKDINNSSNLNKNNGRQIGTIESQEEGKKLKYPKAVFFIISNELCERFAYYGMRTILAIYLQKKLKYTENTATIIFHSFVMLCYFFPIVGGIIADSYLGKFKTIVYLSIVYAVGDIVLAAASASILPIPHRELTILGLVLIAAGTGGIKPCVSAFGGDQFVMPQQEKQLQQFFSVFYFSINIGSMLGTLVAPILRQDIQCLGETTCFPLAFAIPSICMVTAIVIFIAGKSMYKIKKPQGNIVVDVTKCICYALKKKLCSVSTTKHKHWMDFAEDKYDKKLIEDIKIVLSISLILSPTIIFWALFEQQGSSWTFQASRMDGNLWDGVDIKPDQVHIINPFLILLFIPLFQKHVYPFLSKLRLLRTPLQKMSFGGILTALAFFISGFLELQLQPTYAVLPQAGEAQLRIFNGYNCIINLQTEDGINEMINPFDILELKSLQVTNKREIQATLMMDKTNCSKLTNDFFKWSGNLSITESQASSYLITGVNNALSVINGGFDDIEKSDYGKPKLRVIYKVEETTYLSLRRRGSKEDPFYVLLNVSDIIIPDVIISSGKYSLRLNSTQIDSDIILQYGAVYRLMIISEDNQVNFKLFTLTPPNSIHMLWILPQLIVITIAEMFFSITGLEFTFMQAPNSMKSVTSSLWLLTTSFGNLVVVFIAELIQSDNNAIRFFSYGGLMLLVMGVFIILAMRYKYVQIVTEETNENGRVNEGYTTDNDEHKHQ